MLRLLTCWGLTHSVSASTVNSKVGMPGSQTWLRATTRFYSCLPAGLNSESTTLALLQKTAWWASVAFWCRIQRHLTGPLPVNAIWTSLACQQTNRMLPPKRSKWLVKRELGHPCESCRSSGKDASSGQVFTSSGGEQAAENTHGSKRRSLKSEVFGIASQSHKPLRKKLELGHPR